MAGANAEEVCEEFLIHFLDIARNLRKGKKKLKLEKLKDFTLAKIVSTKSLQAVFSIYNLLQFRVV